MIGKHRLLLPSSKKCVWELNDLGILRKVKGGGKYIYKVFGKRSGVRRRALNRLRNGHYYIDTLKTAKVRSKAKFGKTPKDLYIIQCQCLASMRSNVYNVNLVDLFAKVAALIEVVSFCVKVLFAEGAFELFCCFPYVHS